MLQQVRAGFRRKVVRHEAVFVKPRLRYTFNHDSRMSSFASVASIVNQRLMHE